MADKIITFRYANQNLDAYKKQTIPVTDKCMTKAEVNAYLNVQPQPISAYVNNRLVPISKVIGILSSYNSYCYYFNGRVYDIAIQTDGKLIVVGEFTQYKGSTANGIARLNTDGTLDITFDTGTGLILDSGASYYGNPFGYVCKIQSDGKILVGGYFDKYNQTARYSIVRLNTDGSIDTTFDTGWLFTSGYRPGQPGVPEPDVVTICYDILILNGDIYAGGMGVTDLSYNVVGDYNPHILQLALVKLSSTGVFNTTFRNNIQTTLRLEETRTITTDGTNIYFAGRRHFSSTADIVKINTSGVIDTSFPTTLSITVNGSSNNEINKLIFNSTVNKLFYAGRLQNNLGNVRFIARCSTTGTSDIGDTNFTDNNATFLQNENLSTLTDFYIDTDNKLYIGGLFAGL